MTRTIDSRVESHSLCVLFHPGHPCACVFLRTRARARVVDLDVPRRGGEDSAWTRHARRTTGDYGASPVTRDPGRRKKRRHGGELSAIIAQSRVVLRGGAFMKGNGRYYYG